ncbi:MAG: hypothetical protein AAFX58_07865, partial [Pseudomonadota bacterium]
MKSVTLAGLCLGAGLATSATFTLAEPGGEPPRGKTAEAMQIKIDRKTGRKTAEDDSTDATAATATATTAPDTSLMPERTLPAVTHSDGSMSATLGSDAMEYLVMHIDEDGNKRLMHEKRPDTDTDADADADDEAVAKGAR